MTIAINEACKSEAILLKKARNGLRKPKEHGKEMEASILTKEKGEGADTR
jgi:hypothetical protein